MTKPLTIARQEFIEAIVEDINNAELPFFVISDILKSTLAEVKKMSQVQYQQDKNAWDKAQEEPKPKSKSLDDITDEEREAILCHYNKTIGKSIERNLNEDYENKIEQVSTEGNLQ